MQFDEFGRFGRSNLPHDAEALLNRLLEQMPRDLHGAPEPLSGRNIERRAIKNVRIVPPPAPPAKKDQTK